MKQRVCGIGWVHEMCLASIRTDRLNAQSNDVALFNQEADSLGIRAGSMRSVLAAVGIVVTRTLGPVRAQQHPRLGGNATMALFPRFDKFDRQVEIGIGCGFTGCVYYKGLPGKEADRKSIARILGKILARDPMNRRR